MHDKKTRPSETQPQSTTAAATATGTWRCLTSLLYKCALVAAALLCTPLLLLAAIPSLQRLLVYMSWVNYPWANLSNPTAWGFRPDQARSIFIATPDQLSLGAWHILQPNAARAVPTARTPADALPHDHWTVKTDDTVFLYLHGNAGNRALRHRRAFYQTLLTAHMRARRREQRARSNPGTDQGRVHLLAVDYRGFGDSSPVLPSEAGLKLDALAAWTYVTRDLGAQPNQVVVVGHSLGTGVATALVHQLSSANTPPRGLVLLAPFTSIPNAALEYPWVPVWLLGPFKSLLAPLVSEKWDSIDRIADLACNVLIIHGSKDIIINEHHAHALFKRATGKRFDSVKGDGTVSFGTEGATYAAPMVESLKVKKYVSRVLTYTEVAFGGHDDLQEFALTRDVLAGWLFTL